MDASFVALISLTLSIVLLSHQIASDSNLPDGNTGNLECPTFDNATFVDGKLVHNFIKTESCHNGREMPGCCVQRIYCDFNSSHIDLSLYGPPGFRMPCHDVCCPLKYILVIPPSNITDDGSSSSSSDSSDSDSDEDSDLKNKKL